MFSDCAYARAWVRVKMGKCCFESGIVALHFGENYASLPLPISEEAWRTRTCFIIKSVARFTIIRQMAPRPRVQSGLSAALENLAIVIVYFLSLYVFVCVLFSVRLHDSVQDEGFHYLVFDL